MIHRVAKGLIDRGGAGNVSHLSVLPPDVLVVVVGADYHFSPLNNW